MTAIAALSACGGGSPATTIDCPNDVPDACPEVGAPSYATEVAPILQQRCGDCHTAGGQEAVHPLDSYADAKAEKVGILSQLHSCLMPPPSQPQATTAERQTIFTWIVCGAPGP